MALAPQSPQNPGTCASQRTAPVRGTCAAEASCPSTQLRSGSVEGEGTCKLSMWRVVDNGHHLGLTDPS